MSSTDKTSNKKGKQEPIVAEKKVDFEGEIPSLEPVDAPAAAQSEKSDDARPQEQQEYAGPQLPTMAPKTNFPRIDVFSTTITKALQSLILIRQLADEATVPLKIARIGHIKRIRAEKKDEKYEPTEAEINAIAIPQEAHLSMDDPIFHILAIVEGRLQAICKLLDYEHVVRGSNEFKEKLKRVVYSFATLAYAKLKDRCNSWKGLSDVHSFTVQGAAADVVYAAFALSAYVETFIDISAPTIAAAAAATSAEKAEEPAVVAAK